MWLELDSAWGSQSSTQPQPRKDVARVLGTNPARVPPNLQDSVDVRSGSDSDLATHNRRRPLFLQQRKGWPPARAFLSRVLHRSLSTRLPNRGKRMAAYRLNVDRAAGPATRIVDIRPRHACDDGGPDCRRRTGRDRKRTIDSNARPRAKIRPVQPSGRRLSHEFN